MTITQAVLEKLQALPPEKQQEVLAFVESLASRFGAKPLRGSLGLLAPFQAAITDEEIAEARREMWDNFPRDDI